MPSLLSLSTPKRTSTIAKKINYLYQYRNSLETLDLAYNRVTCLEAIEGLTNLRFLNLGKKKKKTKKKLYNFFQFVYVNLNLFPFFSNKIIMTLNGFKSMSLCRSLK